LILTNPFRHVPARCVKPSGRSLEPRSDAWPRGMTVQLEQSRGQNSAYRSGCHRSFIFINLLTRSHLSVRWLRAGIDVRTVQEWLGHESLATTQKYLEPSKETEKQLEDLKLPF
jgi:site-specific recombinase XerD